jgi:acyl dehydratase
MKKIFSTLNHFIDRFLMSMMIVVSFNLAVICAVVLIGAGPELFASVLHGWDGLDFLAVMFIPSTVGAVLLVVGDLALKKFYKMGG